jgi:hypothetical protein
MHGKVFFVTQLFPKNNVTQLFPKNNVTQLFPKNNVTQLFPKNNVTQKIYKKFIYFLNFCTRDNFLFTNIEDPDDLY